MPRTAPLTPTELRRAAPVSTVWLALQHSRTPGAHTFHAIPGRLAAVEVTAHSPARAADVADALAAAGYDVHTPTDRPGVVEAQHLADVVAELEDEATAAELAGRTADAEHKRASVAAALQLLSYYPHA